MLFLIKYKMALVIFYKYICVQDSSHLIILEMQYIVNKFDYQVKIAVVTVIKFQYYILSCKCTYRRY